MRNVMQKMLLASVALGFTAMAANAATNSLPGYSGEIPELSTQLNDIPGDLPVGEYIQYIATNEISTAVVLTNGVLTVGTNSISISPAKHTVITSNYYDGAWHYTTNTYNAVFRDELDESITQATNALDNVVKTIVTTNWIDQSTFTTNVITITNHLAYTYDVVTRPIDPDDTKANKVMKVWDFYCPLIDRTLKMKYSVGVQDKITRWLWSADSPVGGYSSMELCYDGENSDPWYCITNNIVSAPLFTSGQITEPVVNFGSIYFVTSNVELVAFVVYSDYLASNYVDRSSMGYVAGALTNLDTVSGIRNSLLDMKQRLYDIAGGYSTRARLSSIARGNAVRIGSVTMATEGDLVDIDWGDGTIYTATNLPAYHVYTNDTPTAFTIGINGRILSIQGDENHSWITISDDISRRSTWASIGDKLESVSFGHSVGIEEIGKNAFLDCNRIDSLAFIPNTVITLGEGCFRNCTNLHTLSGIPIVITDYPAYCFAGSGISSLNDMPSSVESLGDFCFSECKGLHSLDGISVNLNVLGSSCFSSSGIITLSGLDKADSLTSISDSCFSNTSIYSINKGDIPQSCYAIRELAFSDIPSLVSAYIPDTVKGIGSNAFANVSESFSFTFENRTIRNTEDIVNFPWGGDNDRVGMKVNCIDGWLDGTCFGFITNYTALAFAMENVPHGAMIILGKMILENKEAPVYVDWDDGSQIQVYENGGGKIDEGTISHIYNYEDTSLATNHTLRIYGKIKSIHEYQGAGFVKLTGNIGTIYSGPDILMTAFSVGDKTGLETIDNGCFEGCTNLSVICSYTDPSPPYTELPLPLTITRFGQSSFAGCSSIVNLDWVPTNITSIGERCFASCTSLKTITGLSDSKITELPSACFSNCSALASLIGIPETVESIGEACFAFDVSLSDLNGLPQDLRYIPDYCFLACDGLDSLEGISTNIDSIGSYAFSGAHFVTNASFLGFIGAGDLGYDCFYNMGLASFTNNVDQFGTYNCSINFNMTCAEAIAAGIAESGVPASTRIYCTDGILYGTVRQGGRTDWVVWINTLDINIELPYSNLTVQFCNNAIEHGTNTVSVYWGDGNGPNSISIVNPGTSWESIKHTYSQASNYVVQIYGNISAISGDPVDCRPFFFSVFDTNAVSCIKSVKVNYDPSFTNVGYTGIQRLNSHSFYGCLELETLEGLSIKDSNTGLSEPRVFRNALVARGNTSNIYSPIQAIGNSCFEGCVALTNLVGLPPVLSLPDSCFKNCVSLESLKGMPNSVNKILPNCFNGCISLASFEGISTEIQNIDLHVFEGCTTLQNLLLMPSSVTNYGDNAFAYAYSLSSLIGMDENVRTIQPGAFLGTGLTNLEYMSQNIKKVPSSAFSTDLSLESLKGISTNITDIGMFAFNECTNLTEVNDMPLGVTNFQQYSFSQCFKLTNGVMGNKVIYIGDNFILNSGSLGEPTTDEANITARARIYAKDMRCDKLVQLLNNSSNINSFLEFVCFDGYVVCVEDKWYPLFKTVVIEMENVKRAQRFTVGTIDTFSNSTIRIYWGDGTSDQYYSGLSHVYQTNGNFTVEVNGFAKGIYAETNRYPFITSTGRGNTNIVTVSVGEATKISTLGDFCFKGCSNLKTIYGKKPFTMIGGLENSTIQAFGDECFAGCSSITNLDGMPVALAIIGTGCFSNCTSLADLSAMPSGIEKLSPYCFSYCKGLKSLQSLPDRITRFDIGSFKGCSSLATLEGMNPDLAEAGIECFSGCSSLTNLVGYSLLSLYEREFANCTGLKDLKGIPDGIEYIPSWCFSGCTGLNTLTDITDSVTAINDNAFRGCSSLLNLNGLWKISSIGEGAFCECRGLLTLEGLTTNILAIGDYAFSTNASLVSFGDSPLVNQYYPETYNLTIGNYVFAGSTNFGNETSGEFILPDNISQIGEYAFDGCLMVGCSNIPAMVSSIYKKTFNSTHLKDLTMSMDAITSIASDAFTNDKGVIFSEGGLPTSRIITMINITPDEIIDYPNFPFGCSTNTRFRAVNSDSTYLGSVVWHNGSWITLIDSITATITLSSGTSIELRGITPYDTNGFCVSWGDDSYSNWCEEIVGTNKLIHTYPSLGTYDVKIIRPVKSVGDGVPFIRYLSSSDLTSQSPITTLSFSENSGITEFGRNALSRSSTLNTFPSLPSTTTSLGIGCFYGDSAIDRIADIPESVTNIGYSAFEGCSSAGEVVLDIPYLDSIKTRMFYQCTSLTNVEFGAATTNLKSIGEQSFYRCYALESADFSECINLETIERNAFNSCTNLYSLFLPQSVENIASNAFYRIGEGRDYDTDPTIYEGYLFKSKVYFMDRTCASVTNMVGFPWNASTNVCMPCIDGEIINVSNNWIVNYGPFNCILDVPANSQVTIRLGANYGNVNYIRWGDSIGAVTNIYPASGTVITNHTYANAGRYYLSVRGPLTSIFGNNGIPFLSIGNSKTNDFLKHIFISNKEGFIRFGDYALSNCISLDGLDDITAEYTGIGVSAFAGCTNIYWMSIPKTCTQIGDTAFAGCQNVLGIKLPQNRNLTMGSRVFAGCYNLADIQIDTSYWPSMTSTTLADYAGSVEMPPWSVHAESVRANLIKSAYQSSDYVVGVDNMYGYPTNCQIHCWDGTIAYGTKSNLSAWWLNRQTMEIIVDGIVDGTILDLALPDLYGSNPFSRSTSKASIEQRRSAITKPSLSKRGIRYNDRRQKEIEELKRVFASDQLGEVNIRGVGRFKYGNPNFSPNMRRSGTKLKGMTNSRTTVLNIRNCNTKSSTKRGLRTSLTDIINHNEIEIDWGDGTVQLGKNYAFMKQGYTHDYKRNLGKVKIIIRGKVRKLNPTSSDMPFLKQGHLFASTYNIKDSPANVTSIKINDGMNMKELSDGCFKWIGSLTNCVLPSTLNTIGKECFKGTGIKDLSFIPYGVKDIPERCFVGCTNITSLLGLPSHVQTIGKEAFAGKESYLGYVYSYPDSYGDTKWNDIINPYTKVNLSKIVKMSSLNGMTNAVELTEVGPGCFAYTQITNLSGWSALVQTVPAGCFYHNRISSLAGLPSGVTRFSGRSFGDTALRDLTGMPSTVNDLGLWSLLNWKDIYGAGCFFGCKHLDSFTGISPNVDTFPPYSFMECTNIVGITQVPQTIMRIHGLAIKPISPFILDSTDRYPLVFSDFGIPEKEGRPNGMATEVSSFSDATYPRDVFCPEGVFCASAPDTNNIIRPVISIILTNIVANDTVSLGKIQTYSHKRVFSPRGGSEVTINKRLNEMLRMSYQSPIWIRWGDGTKSIITPNEYEEIYGANHQYSNTGAYTIELCGFINSIDSEIGFPFVQINGETENTNLVDFSFTDVVDLSAIGCYCFTNCPNFDMIRNVATVNISTFRLVDDYWIDPVTGVISPWGIKDYLTTAVELPDDEWVFSSYMASAISPVYMHYLPYTSPMIRNIPNYPFGNTRKLYFHENATGFNPTVIGVPTEPTIIPYDMPIGDVLPQPAREHYEFLGWYTATNGTEKVTESSRITSNTDLYARWQRIECTVKFLNNLHYTYVGDIVGGKEYVTNMAEEVYYTYTTNYTRAIQGKYYVNGRTYYAKNSPFAPTVVGISVIAHKHTRTVRKDVFKTIKQKDYAYIEDGYNQNDTENEPIQEVKVLSGDSITEVPAITNSWYDFEGWYTDSSGGVMVITNNTIITNIETKFYSRWGRRRTIEITLDANGGTLTNSTINMLCGDPLGKIETPFKEGVPFSGWYFSPTGTIATTESTRLFEDTTLYAQWSTIANLIFNPMGGIVSPTNMWLERDGVIRDLPTPTKTLYNFVGWFSEPSGGTVFSEGDIITRDITLYAHWTNEIVRVIFNDGYDGAPITTNYYPRGGALGELPVPIRRRYAFINWLRNDGNGSPITPETRFYGDQVVRAHWAIDYITVNFDENGGTYIKSKKELLARGDSIYEFPTTVKQFCTLKEWNTSPAGVGTTVTTNTPIQDSITLYAIWTEPQVTVTFDPRGGTVSPTNKKVAVGSMIGDMPAPHQDRNRFLGWSYSSSGVNPYSTVNSIVTGDTTLYAGWELIKYTVVFDNNSSTLPQYDYMLWLGGIPNGITRTVVAGDPIGNLPYENLPNLAFTISGWYTQKVGGQEYVSTTPVLTNLTLYAHWRRINYVVDLKTDEGYVTPWVLHYPLNPTQIGELPIPTVNEQNKRFQYWKYQDTNQRVRTTDLVDRDRTLIAVWKYRSTGVETEPIGCGVKSTSSTLCNEPTSTSGMMQYFAIPIDNVHAYVIARDGSYRSGTMAIAAADALAIKLTYGNIVTDQSLPSLLNPAYRRTNRHSKRGTSLSTNALFTAKAGAYKGTVSYAFDLDVYNPVHTNIVSDYAFYNFTTMTNLPPLSYDVESIGSHAFENTKISDFSLPTSFITNIGDRAFASLQLQKYTAKISGTNITMGVDVFGEHYPFGVSQKTIEFPNITTNELWSMPNFPFAKMIDKALGKDVEIGYVNTFTIYRCKDGIELHPVATNKVDGKVQWGWAIDTLTLPEPNGDVVPME